MPVITQISAVETKPRDTSITLPSVSVIVPVHNEAKLLGRTLSCLQLQEYPDPSPQIITALNGCTDASRAVAEEFGVQVVESHEKGISFGRNLGVTVATGDLLVFIDADTTIPATGLREIVDAVNTNKEAIAVLPGKAVRGGAIVKICFGIANRYAKRRRVLSPGPVMATQRSVYVRVNGFDENLPQGEATDFVVRCRVSGAQYLFLDDVPATTSIRRFERYGIIQQLLSWRINHWLLERGQRKRVSRRVYPVVR